MNGVMLALFGGFWTAIVLMFDVMATRDTWKQFESNRYPHVMGAVTHSEMTIHHGNKGGTSYGVDIQYHYVVEDHPYDGKRYRYGSTSSSRDWADAIVSEHPVDSQTPVYFNAANPQDAVLAPGLKGIDLFMVLFLTPFNLIAVGFCAATGKWLRELIFKPVAGGVKIIADGPRILIRLPEYTALLWCMVTMGGLSFVSVFVLGFGSGMNPPIWASALTLSIVIGASAAVYIRQWRKIHSGEDDLVLDETSATIVLPETCGRKTRVTVTRSDIKTLTVEKVEHRSSKGGVSYTYAPTLWLGQELGRSEKLADWSNRKRAEAFAAWLRPKLNLPGDAA